jgi:hypothetical protein
VPLGLILAIRQTWSLVWGSIYGFPFFQIGDYVQLLPSYLSTLVIPFLFFYLAIELFSLQAKPLFDESSASVLPQAVRP